MILRYLHMNLHQMRNTDIFMTKKNIFWLQTAEKVSTTLINPTRNIKSQHPQLTSTSPVRENIFLVREQRKSLLRELSLSTVRQDHSPVRMTSKAGKKRQDESNEQKKRKKIRPTEEGFNQYASRKQMAMTQSLKESHRVCRV